MSEKLKIEGASFIWDWMSVRRSDGTINLVMAWEKALQKKPGLWDKEDEAAVSFLLTVESLQPINSLQVAAIAIALAMGMVPKKK